MREEQVLGSGRQARNQPAEEQGSCESSSELGDDEERDIGRPNARKHVFGGGRQVRNQPAEEQGCGKSPGELDHEGYIGRPNARKRVA